MAPEDDHCRQDGNEQTPHSDDSPSRENGRHASALSSERDQIRTDGGNPADDTAPSWKGGTNSSGSGTGGGDGDGGGGGGGDGSGDGDRNGDGGGDGGGDGDGNGDGGGGGDGNGDGGGGGNGGGNEDRSEIGDWRDDDSEGWRDGESRNWRDGVGDDNYSEEVDPAGAPDITELQREVARLRSQLDEFEEDIESRTVERPKLKSELRRYVRRRMRRGHARGWGPYLVLLYGTVATLGAFYWLDGIYAIGAMIILGLSTLGLYVLFILFGIGLNVAGVPFRAIDAYRRRRE